MLYPHVRDQVGLFSSWVLKERLRINERVAFGLILVAVGVAMSGRAPEAISH